MPFPSRPSWGRNVLILICLATFLLAPRPLAGWLDLATARRLEQAGDYAAAADRYLSAIRRIPWKPSLWERAGDACFEGEDYHCAAEYYGRAASLDALSPTGRLRWGEAALALGDPRFAVIVWNELLDDGGDPIVILPRLARGYRALALGSAGDSLEFCALEIQTWQQYLNLRPDDAAARYRLGLLLAATSPADALPELTRAAQLDSRLDSSVQALRTGLNTALLSDNEPYRFLLAGRALAAQGEWELAAEAFRRSLSLDSAYGAAWAWLGEAEQHLGQDGLPHLEKALALDPDSAMVNVLYGLYWQRQGQPQKALAAYEIAVRAEPETAAWHVALGSAHEQNSDLVSALLEYLYAVALDPSDAAGWRALALYSISTGHDLEGIGLPASERLLALAPADWLSHDIAGQAAFALGRYPEADGHFLKAIELAPRQAAPHLHLALVYLEQGDRAAARAELEAACLLDPQGPLGEQAGRLLEKYFP